MTGEKYGVVLWKTSVIAEAISASEYGYVIKDAKFQGVTDWHWDCIAIFSIVQCPRHILLNPCIYKCKLLSEMSNSFLTKRTSVRRKYVNCRLMFVSTWEKVVQWHVYECLWVEERATCCHINILVHNVDFS